VVLTVTFDLNGGDGTVPSALNVDIDSTVPKSQAPVEPSSGWAMYGYQHDGKWYIKKEMPLGMFEYVEFIFGADGTQVIGSITLYLMWTNYEYTVKNGIDTGTFNATKAAHDGVKDVAVGKAWTTMTTLVQTDAGGNACTITFARNTGGQLDIGTNSWTFNGGDWGHVTLCGDLVSGYTDNSRGIIHLTGGMNMRVDAAITASGNGGTALYNESGGVVNVYGTIRNTGSGTVGAAIANTGTEGTVNIYGTVSSISGNAVRSGGTVNVYNGIVSSVYGTAIYSASIVNIYGGTVSSETGTAVHLYHTGIMTVSESETVRTYVLSGGSYTIRVDTPINVPIGHLDIKGGTIRNTLDGGTAIFCLVEYTVNISGGNIRSTGNGYAVDMEHQNGAVTLSGTPYITGKIRVAPGKLSVIGSFVPQTAPYAVELRPVSENVIAVVNGAGFIPKFDFINRGDLVPAALNGNIILTALRIDISNDDGSLYGSIADIKTEYYVYDEAKNILTILKDEKYTIWQKSGSHNFAGMIIVSNATVTIDGVTFDGNIVLQASSVKLSLSGISTIGGSILVPEGTALTIDSSSSTGSRDGSLNITASDRYSAGIGGGHRQTAGTITVNGGTVDVQGGKYAAGIGGGYGGDGGTVTLNGGKVTAQGGTFGAGIGGGYGGDGGTFTTNGGEVLAYGGEFGTDIGGGYGVS
jgi:hypothetical protein